MLNTRHRRAHVSAAILAGTTALSAPMAASAAETVLRI